MAQGIVGASNAQMSTWIDPTVEASTATSDPTVSLAQLLARSFPMDDMVDRFTQKPQDAVARTATAVGALVRAWASRFTPSSDSRIDAAALAVTVAAPDWSAQRLELLADAIVWFFAVDDVIDERRASDPAISGMCERIVAMAKGQAQSTHGIYMPVHSALEDLLLRLSSYSLYGRLRHHWSSRLESLLDAMIWENKISDRFHFDPTNRGLPSYQDYIERTRVSIALPPFASLVMIVASDDSVTEKLDEMEALIQHAGTCVRLANDLASSDRERGESKVNAVDIRKNEMEVSGVPELLATDRADRWIRQQIELALTSATDAAERVQTRSRGPELTVLRMAAFAARFYAHYDFNTYPGMQTG